MAITGGIFLYNRGEVIAALSLQEGGLGLNDLQLTLQAYAKWGPDLSSFLVGDFAFAIWDTRRRELYCCRDHMGVLPFYYANLSRRFIFASDPRIILSSPGFDRKINLRKLAGTVVYNGHLGAPEETFHEQIFSLPAGSSCIVSHNGSRKFSYWTPQIQSRLVPRQPEEAFAALRELAFQAINARLPQDGSSAAVPLSGGLDSSAIVSVAARCLQNGGRVLALSGVLPGVPPGSHLTDEREFIDEFRNWPEIRIEYVSAAGRGPFDDIHDPSRFEVTPIRNPFTYLKIALAETGLSNGASVAMSGLFGEFGLTTKGERYPLELLLKLRWPTLIREVRSAGRVQGTSPVRYAVRRILDPFRARRGVLSTRLVLLTPQFRKFGRPQGGVTYMGPDQSRLQAAEVEYVRGKYADLHANPDQALRATFPWLDKRIIEFCLSAPSDLKLRNGYERYLVRGALDGILPPKIQWRISKLSFSPDYLYRYNAQLGKARELVADIAPRDPIRDVIDIESLSRLLLPVDPRVRSRAAKEVVPATIYAICFLRQFAEFRP